MKRLALLACCCGWLVQVGWVAAAQAPQPAQPVEAIDGLDPVVLVKTGKEAFGKGAFRSEQGRFYYLFESAATKQEFDADPGRFAIQLDGACARMGGARGNPSQYALVNGKIYIFASDECQKLFVATPERFLPKPAPPLPSDAKAQADGRALLDRAAAAHGGATLDALTTYSESVVGASQGSMPAPPRTVVTWRFPDSVRSERSMTMSGQTRQIVNLLTGGEAFNGTDDMPELRRMYPEGTRALQQQMFRALVPLLKNRNLAGTKVAAIGPVTIGGTALDRVRLMREGLDVTLNIDKTTGRVHSTTSIERGLQAAIGELTVVFGDYRQVAGVLVPFTEQAQFEGAPAPQLSRTLETAAMNPVVDASLFKAAK